MGLNNTHVPIARRGETDERMSDIHKWTEFGFSCEHLFNMFVGYLEQFLKYIEFIYFELFDFIKNIFIDDSKIQLLLCDLSIQNVEMLTI